MAYYIKHNNGLLMEWDHVRDIALWLRGSIKEASLFSKETAQEIARYLELDKENYSITGTTYPINTQNPLTEIKRIQKQNEH